MWEQEKLLKELYTEMYIVAYSKLRNKMDAHDVVQESWIKILTKINTLKEKNKIKPWAKTIVCNTANNLLKKKFRKVEVLLCEERFASLKMISERTVPLDEQCIQRFVMNEIYDGIKQLDVDIRRIFDYKFFGHWKDRQIADEMRLPLGTVKAKLNRGKERLRIILHKKHMSNK